MQMSNINAKTPFSWKEHRSLIIALALFSIIGIAYYFGSQREDLQAPSEEKSDQVITLTPEEEAELLRKMTPPPDAKPILSDKELETLGERMTPPKDAKPTLSDDELQKLLQSMTPQ